MPKSGFLTPSSFDNLMSNGKKAGEIGKTAFSVVDRLVLDFMNVEIDEVDAPSLEWGKDNEWLAIEKYQEETLQEVRQANFTVANDCTFVGGTMDGLVGNVGGIEVKCPKNPLNHILRNYQYENYKWQIQGYMWIYNLEWIDFVSFDPRYPKKKQLIIERKKRDNDMIKLLKERCKWAYDKAKEKAEIVNKEVFKEA